MMKIGILINHPTQFEGPFFKYAGQDQENELQVLYIDRKRMADLYDPELGTKINWGIDLLKGYAHAVAPEKSGIRWLRNKLKREKYDLLIVNGYYKLPLIAGALIAKLLGTKVCLRLDSISLNNRNPFKLLLKKMMYAFFNRVYDHYFAVSSLTKEFLMNMGVQEGKISIFSYVVDNDYFKANSTINQAERQSLRAELLIPDGCKVVLSVCKFNARELPWDLLKAFNLLKDEKIWLVLVGDGRGKERIEDYVSGNSLFNITLAGYVHYPDLPKYYGIADVFVHPALNEPWGVSVQEAMACGLPVIVSDRVGAGFDLIEKGENGFIYPAGNYSDLKEKIEDVLFRMDRKSVEAVNARILSGWHYRTSWKEIIRVAGKLKNL